VRGTVLKANPGQAPATLNAAQLDAVHHLRGPCLVLAGAGSGKTRIIVHKIARLLEAGYAPAQIAAITFTNKAAAEMRERAKSLVGARAAAPLAISTFHSLGVRMLRGDGERLGLKKNFSILDSDDVLGVLKDAGGTTDNALARRWQWTIGAWKNRGLDASGAAAELVSGAALPTGMSAADALVAARLMQRYEERLSAYQAVDFDDLIVLPAKLLARDAEVRDAWRARLRYVLVDEYQDTNGIQYELMKLIAGEAGLFTAVGDDDQSIYGWRGATVDNLKRLPADYPALRVIALEQNYRSTGSILAAANAVIAHNPKLYEKKLWSELGSGEPVRIVECDNEVHEADRAVGQIPQHRRKRFLQMKNQSVVVGRVNVFNGCVGTCFSAAQFTAKERIERPLDVARSQELPVVEVDPMMQMENIGLLIGHFPTVSQPRLEVEVVVPSDQRIEEQFVDSLRLRIHADPRVKIRRTALNDHHQRVGIGFAGTAGVQEQETE